MAINAQISRPVQVDVRDIYQGLGPLQQLFVERSADKFDTLQQQMADQIYLIDQYAADDADWAAEIQKEYVDKSQAIRDELKYIDKTDAVAKKFHGLTKKYASDPRLHGLAARQQKAQMGVLQAGEIGDQKTRSGILKEIATNMKKNRLNPDGSVNLDPLADMTYYDRPSIPEAAIQIISLASPTTTTTETVLEDGTKIAYEYTSGDGMRHYVVSKGSSTKKIDGEELAKLAEETIMNDGNVLGWLSQDERLFGVESRTQEEAAMRQQIQSIANLRAMGKETVNTETIVDKYDSALALAAKDKSKETAANGQLRWTQSMDVAFMGEAYNPTIPREVHDFRETTAKDLDNKLSNLFLNDPTANSVTPVDNLAQNKSVVHKNANGIYDIPNIDAFYDADLYYMDGDTPTKFQPWQKDELFSQIVTSNMYQMLHNTIHDQALTEANSLLPAGNKITDSDLKDYNEFITLPEEEKLRVLNTGPGNVIPSYAEYEQAEKTRWMREQESIRKSYIPEAVNERYGGKDTGPLTLSKDDYYDRAYKNRFQVDDKITTYMDSYNELFYKERNKTIPQTASLELPVLNLGEKEKTELGEVDRQAFEALSQRAKWYAGDEGGAKLTMLQGEGNITNNNGDLFQILGDGRFSRSSSTKLSEPKTISYTDVSLLGYTTDDQNNLVEVIQITYPKDTSIKPSKIKDAEMQTETLFVRSAQLNNLQAAYYGVTPQEKVIKSLDRQLRQTNGYAMYSPPAQGKFGYIIYRDNNAINKVNNFTYVAIDPSGKRTVIPNQNQNQIHQRVLGTHSINWAGEDAIMIAN